MSEAAPPPPPPPLPPADAPPAGPRPTEPTRDVAVARRPTALPAARRRRADRAIALALCLGATAVTAVAGRTQGFPRDEAIYFNAAELYWGWFGELGDNVLAGRPLASLSRASIERWWSFNDEHPALMKTLYGISWRLLHKCHCPSQPGRHPVGYARRHRTLGLLSEAAAMRLPADLFAGVLVGLTYLFGARAFSRRAGLVAAVLSLAAPRLFFHAQLSAFDAPVATTWLACVYAYWRSLDEPRWAWRTGLLWGLSLATKLNGFFLPVGLLAHYLWVERDRLRALRLPPLAAAFWWMAALGPLVELAHWPWLWIDTVAHFRAYAAFHLHHVYYNMEFLGRNYNKPPFPKSFPFVMTLLTAPVTTLALAIGGAAALVAGHRRHPAPLPAVDERTWRRPAAGIPTAPGLLIGLNALYPMCIIAFTGAPIFGATKHWLASIPFIALLAGYGADRLAGALVGEGAPRARLVTAATLVLAAAPAIVETARSHPYGLTHYNLLAGGPAGGADLGMNRQFWGYATRGVLPWVNAHAPPSASIYWHDTFQLILDMDVREGLLRDDVRDSGLEEPGVRASEIAMVIHEKHFDKYEYWIWDFYGTARPSLVLTDEGVPVVTLYERPSAAGGAARR